MRFAFGDCTLDEELFELRRNGERVSVQPKVLRALLLLVRNRPRTLPQSELVEALWPGVHVSDDSLFRTVHEARRVIGDEAHEIIVTVRGMGFRFAAEASEVGARVAMERSPHLGRDHSMAALSLRLDAAAAGRGSFAWISGLPGMGKTRLLDQLVSTARSRSALVYEVACHAAPPAPPYWLWSRLLQAAAATGGEPGNEARRVAARLDQTAGDATFGPFEAVAKVFTSLAAVQPLVLALDDVHWADDASLLLMQFFAREIRNARVLVACTHRDGASSEGRDRTIGGLVGEYGSVTVRLRPLGRDEVQQLVETLVGRPCPTPFVDEVFERTGGSPLLVRQLLATDWAAEAMAESDRTMKSTMALDGGIRESIGRHLGEVSKESRDALEWAAVAGKEIELVMLPILTGLPRQRLLDLLDEAVRASLVVKVSEGRYRFAHGLVAPVLLARLSSTERAARHRAVAEAIVSCHPDSLDTRAAELAVHYLRAAPLGTAQQAFDLASRAARRAARLADTRGAIKNWKRALEALDCLPGSDPARVDVQLELGLARAEAGDAERARDALFDAAMLGAASERPDVVGRAAVALSALGPVDQVRLGAFVKNALRDLRGDDGLSARLRALLPQ
jgi:DNA-binding winged helix-turn-helix (wHTH) protein